MFTLRVGKKEVSSGNNIMSYFQHPDLSPRPLRGEGVRAVPG